MTLSEYKKLCAIETLLLNDDARRQVPADRLVLLRADYRELMRRWWAATPDERRALQDEYRRIIGTAR